MIRQRRGGSVAIVAPIRTGKPHFAKRSDFRLMITEGKLDGTTLTMTRYWKNGLGSGVTTGIALMKAKAQMIEDAKKAPGYHLCICELNLLGDPTLDMRSQTPQSPKLTLPKKIRVGAEQLQVATGIPNSTVCAWKKDDCYQVVKADASGRATIDVTTKTPGKLMVSVGGANLNVAQQAVVVVAKQGASTKADTSGEN